MKRPAIHRFIALFLLIMSGLGTMGHAQTPRPSPYCALFFTSNDYLAASDDTLHKMDASKEFAHLWLRTNRLIAKGGNERIVIPKDSVYGYRLRNQKCYRWDGNAHRPFEIMENKAVVIYKAYEPQYGSKGYVPGPVLYFSRELDGCIMELNVLNLKRAFPSSFEFHHLLDLLHDPKVISGYDQDHGMYIVNYLLLRTNI